MAMRTAVTRTGFRLCHLAYSQTHSALCPPISTLNPVLRQTPSVLHHVRRNAASDSRVPKDAGNSTTDDKTSSKLTKKESNGLLDRMLRTDESGESPLLRFLGYYGAESKAIGAANSFYSQILTRASSTVEAEFPAPLLDFKPESTEAVEEIMMESGILTSAHFLPKYEMMALHIYLTLRRLRQENGSPYEADVKMAMQTLFDKFWTDVRYRMMIDEHKLSLLQSGKWIKQCEKNFFSMALAFDEAWDAPREKISDCISKHITCLKKDPQKVSRFLHYMLRERLRLDKIPIEQLWEGGVCWEAKYSPVLS